MESNWLAHLRDGASTIELREASRSSDVEVRRAVAKNAAADQETLSRLVTDEDKYVRTSVVKNPSLSVQDLRRFLDDAEEEVRHHVAIHPKVTLSILEDLASAGTYLTHCIVARHPLLGDKLAWTFLCSEDRYVRSNLAKNHTLDEDMMLNLVADGDDLVLRSLSTNKSITPSIMRMLPARCVDAGHLNDFYPSHPSLDMVMSLHLNWEGSVGELLDAVVRLDASAHPVTAPGQPDEQRHQRSPSQA